MKSNIVPKESTIDFLKAIAKGKHRKGAGKRIKKLIAEKELSTYGHILCFCCGSNISINTATIEHIIPVSKGGGMVIDNLALSHRKCNEIRGDSGSPRFSNVMENT